MSRYQIAQINVGRFLYLRDDPANADFMNALDPVNAQAESAPGFIWRLVGDGNDATDLIPDESDPQLLVNMSVWTDVEALAAFVYRNSDHLAFMRRRKEWFEKIELFMALWWVPAGHIPSVEEGMERVALLRAHGPTESAFTFRHTFAAPDGTAAIPQLDECA
jgi:heme-degrading monooxygenase HmoA